MEKNVNLIRWEEAKSLLAKVKEENDLALDQFLNNVNYIVLCHFNSRDPEQLPVTDFDLYFFLKAVEQFFENRDFIRSVIAGEDLSEFRDERHKVSISERLRDYSEAGRRNLCLRLKDIFKAEMNPSLAKAIFDYYRGKTDDVPIGLVRMEEAMGLLARPRGSSSEDRITYKLMHYASYFLWSDVVSGENGPAVDLDLYFSMQVIKEFCEDHAFLKRVLSGEDLRWFSDSDDEGDHLIV
ncbi:MAG: hypothetical protein L0229_03255 [Blastocatellia bacterium]|nr:hypothetical protein [Blastocatellia bacterium]